MVFEPMKGAKMSVMGARMVWRGSRGPQEVAAWFAVPLLGVSFMLGLEVVDAERFLRLPPLVLVLVVVVPARGREERPALRALTRSLQ